MDELNKIKQQLRKTEADKLALDQFAANSIRENIELRSQVILLQRELFEKDEKISSLDNQLNQLVQETAITL